MNTPTSFAIASPEMHTELNWFELENLKPSFHEAGHAVIARLTGYEVAWVSIDSDFIMNDPLALQNRSAHGHPLCMTIASVRMNPILNKKSALNKSDKETVVGYCMHVLAGPFAECQMHPPSFNPAASANDYSQVTTLLHHVEPNIPARKKLLNTARRNLNRAINEYWSEISNVAELLRERGTLSGDDIDTIIQSLAVAKAA